MSTTKKCILCNGTGFVSIEGKNQPCPECAPEPSKKEKKRGPVIQIINDAIKKTHIYIPPKVIKGTQ